MNLDSRGRGYSVIVFAIAVILVLSASMAYGQARFATITGRALDPKGASVPDAKVTALNVDTGIARTTTTTSDGIYRFEELVPGTYDVAIEAAAFTKGVAKAVKIQVGESRDVNFNLELAGQKESVIVTSEVPLVETTKTDVSINIDDRDMASLPTTTAFAAGGGVANDWQGLAYAAPGMRTDYTGLSSEMIGPGMVNSRGVVHNVDGGDVSDVSTSVRDTLGASVEEVKEFEVITNNYNAEYGQAGGIILNVITKSGTNTIHGDGHAYFRGRNMGASDFFYNQGGGSFGCPASDFTAGKQTSIDGCGRAPFYKHEYGFTAGGPFIKDKLFWFTSLEQVQQGLPQVTTPFGTTVVSASPTTELLWSAKVDAKLTDKHTLTARFNEQRDLTDNLVVQTGPAVDSSGLVSSVTHDGMLNIGMVSTPTSHTVNEARFYWHWDRSATPDKSTVPGQSIPGGYLGAAFCCPQAGLNNRFEYIDNFSWTHGSHTMKAGALIQHLAFDSLFGQYHFGRYENFVAAGTSGTTCSGIDTPFLQFPQAQGVCPTTFVVGVGSAFNHVPDTAYGAYIQDTWQIKRNLTMNYGLRYDIEIGAFTGGTVNKTQDPINLTNNGQCFQRNGIIPACGHDYNNWQPRLGFAWSPSYDHGFLHTLFGNPGRSVVRASGAVITELAYLNVVLDSLNFDGVSLLTATADSSTANGKAILANFPNFPSAVQLKGLIPVGKFGRIRPISPTIKNPNIYQANLSITRQLGQSFVASVGYQGVFGNGLFGETDENFPTPILDTTPGHDVIPGTTTPAQFFYLGPRPDPRFTAERTNFSNRTSSYHALVLTANKRLSHHFQFGANYTFSKTLGTGEDFFGLSEPGNPLINLKNDKALSQQDIRHLANFTFVFDTEKLTGMRFVRTAINDWTFSFIASVQTGRPYPVSTGDGSFSGSAFPALGNETNQRPNICTAGSTLLGCAGAPVGALVATNIGTHGGSALAISEAGVAQCMNPALNAGNPLVLVLPAAAPNCNALQTTWLAPAGASGSGPVDTFSGDPVDFQQINGNLARNAGLTKGLTDFDISLLKAFRIPKRESMRLEFKLDVFNIFNHTNFIANDSNNTLNTFSFASLTVEGNVPDPGNPGHFLPVTNPGFNCTTSCINPFSGLYQGANGAPLTLSVFRAGRPLHNLQDPQWLGLGNPASDTAPGALNRVIQAAVRIRF